MTINFCTQCGHTLEWLIPKADNRHRHVCLKCGYIHYLNPKIVAGCLVYHGKQVLMCRRAIEPRRGFWTLPAGYMENGETTRQAAERETWEETSTVVKTGPLFVVSNLPQRNHVNVIYLAELQQHDYQPTPETLEVRLFSEDDIPWDDIAFMTMKTTLKHFFADLHRGEFTLHELEF